MSDETKPAETEQSPPLPPPPVPADPPLPPLPRPDVTNCMRLYGNTVRVESAELFFLITDCIPYLEKMQVRTLVATKIKFKDQEYISRSDFKVVTAIFRRVKAHLMEQFKDQPEWCAKLRRAILQGETIEEEADKLMKTMVRAGKGDFEVIEKPAHRPWAGVVVPGMEAT